jgi:hypothetical protein
LVLKLISQLNLATAARQELDQSLDWSTDGAVLIDVDGRATYSNPMFESIADANDGIGLKAGRIAFSGTAARRHGGNSPGPAEVS